MIWDLGTRGLGPDAGPSHLGCPNDEPALTSATDRLTSARPSASRTRLPIAAPILSMSCAWCGTERCGDLRSPLCGADLLIVYPKSSLDQFRLLHCQRSFYARASAIWE